MDVPMYQPDSNCGSHDFLLFELSCILTAQPNGPSGVLCNRKHHSHADTPRSMGSCVTVGGLMLLLPAESIYPTSSLENLDLPPQGWQWNDFWKFVLLSLPSFVSAYQVVPTVSHSFLAALNALDASLSKMCNFGLFTHLQFIRCHNRW